MQRTFLGRFNSETQIPTRDAACRDLVFQNGYTHSLTGCIAGFA
jgi:hypothetical protein